MRKKKLKKSVIIGLYSLGVFAFLGTLYYIETNYMENTFIVEKVTYVTKTIFDNEIPVVSTKQNATIIIRPYIDQEIKIMKAFYDYAAGEEAQQNSIIYYEGTYLQNSGVIYGGKDNFDVVSILDGIVTKVEEDQTLGMIVEIKHNDTVTSLYQSLGSVDVKVNDTVVQGQIIGKSGVSNLASDLGSHLHFELIISGNTVNPEEYYNKKLDEI